MNRRVRLSCLICTIRHELGLIYSFSSAITLICVSVFYLYERFFLNTLMIYFNIFIFKKRKWDYGKAVLMSVSTVSPMRASCEGFLFLSHEDEVVVGL